MNKDILFHCTRRPMANRIPFIIRVPTCGVVAFTDQNYNTFRSQLLGCSTTPIPENTSHPSFNTFTGSKYSKILLITFNNLTEPYRTLQILQHHSPTANWDHQMPTFCPPPPGPPVFNFDVQQHYLSIMLLIFMTKCKFWCFMANVLWHFHITEHEKEKRKNMNLIAAHKTVSGVYLRAPAVGLELAVSAWRSVTLPLHHGAIMCSQPM